MVAWWTRQGSWRAARLCRCSHACAGYCHVARTPTPSLSRCLHRLSLTLCHALSTQPVSGFPLSSSPHGVHHLAGGVRGRGDGGGGEAARVTHAWRCVFTLLRCVLALLRCVLTVLRCVLTILR
jgi:hypothetical protein